MSQAAGAEAPQGAAGVLESRPAGGRLGWSVESRRGEWEGVGTDGPSKLLPVTREDFEQRRADTVCRLREPLWLLCGRRKGPIRKVLSNSPGRGRWLGWVSFVEAGVLRRAKF